MPLVLLRCPYRLKSLFDILDIQVLSQLKDDHRTSEMRKLQDTWVIGKGFSHSLILFWVAILLTFIHFTE